MARALHGCVRHEAKQSCRQERLMDSPTGPHAVVTRLYQLISGPAEHQRDWAAVRELFAPGAMLRSELTLPDGSRQSGCWTVAEFCEAAASDYRDQGFWEEEIAFRMERFGPMAHVWSTYRSRVGTPDSDPVGRGINSIQLSERRGRWHITGLVFQLEHRSGGIPEEYLTPAGGVGQAPPQTGHNVRWRASDPQRFPGSSSR
jgi:hypothetical protein